jgi:hypothetical protein
MNQPVDDSDDTREHFVRAAPTSQEAISSAIRIWGETTQSMFGLTSAPGAAAPALEHLLERWFDAAEDMLRAQREFSEGLLGLGKPAMEAVARAAQQTSEAMEKSAKDIPEQVRSAARQPPRQRAAAHDGS